MTTTSARWLAAPFLRPLPWLTRLHLVLLAWFAAIVVALWVGAVLVANGIWSVEISMAQFARQGSTWFPFAIAISTLSAYHAVHIAAGLTRRSLVATTLMMAGIMSVLVSGFVVALFALERLVYGVNGWPQQIVDNGWFLAPGSDLPAIFGWDLLNVAAAQVSGLLVGVTYLRAGALRGTLALPLSAAPVVLVMVGLSRGIQAEWLTTPVRIGVSLLVIAAAAAAYAVLVRGLQLRPPRT